MGERSGRQERRGIWAPTWPLHWPPTPAAHLRRHLAGSPLLCRVPYTLHSIEVACVLQVCRRCRCLLRWQR